MKHKPIIVNLPNWWPGPLRCMRGRSFTMPIGFKRSAIFISPQDRSTPEKRHVTIEHELIHASQIARHGGIVFLFRYLFSRNWRFRYEAQAFAASVIARKGNERVWVRHYARVLVKQYKLHTSETIAELIIMAHIRVLRKAND